MRYFRINILTVLCGLLIIQGAGRLWAADSGSEPPAKVVSLNDLVAEAYRNNPSIQASRKAWRAAIEKYRLNTAYPDPQLMVTYFTDPIETRLGPQDWNASLSQMIPFPGKLTKVGEMVEADARIAKLTLDKTVRDVIVGVKSAYFELGYIRRAKAIARQNKELLDHLRKAGETAYAQDEADLMDVVKAQSQVGQLQYDIILLDDLEATEITRLNEWLNRPPETPVAKIEMEIPSPPALSLETLYKLAEQHQEEVQIAKTMVDKADKRLDLAYYQNLPDFKVGLFYAAIGEPDVPSPPENAGQDAVGIQAGMSIPLWFGKSSGRVGAARAELNQAKAQQRSRINKAHTKIRETYFRLQNARRLMELYQQELLPQAAKSMEIAETWFKSGESSFSDFVETQAVWYNFQLAQARAQADYGKFLARLEGLVGQSLSPAATDINPKAGKDVK